MKILITGGSRGIGRACVEKFASEGHEVAFFYKENAAAAAETARLTGAIAIQCDVSDACAVKQAMEQIGAVDVLVNNAGMSSFSVFDEISDEEWKSVLNVNLSGAFYVTREAIKPMIINKWGRVINIGSMWGKVGASCEVHYSASKAGLRGMTKALAKELGPSGITVNCVEPGVIDTEMNAHISADDMAILCLETPLGRIGRAAEVASLVYFLSTDEASFITGQTVGIDGGYAI